MRQRIGLGIFLAVCMALLAACGGNGASSGNGVVTKPIVTPTPTLTPQSVTVTLTDNAIHSSMTTFTSDVPYTFTVTNKGSQAHDFIIGNAIVGTKPTVTPQPSVPPQAQVKPLYVVSSSQLSPGKTVSFTYQFPASIGQAYIQFSEHLAGQSGPQGPDLPIQVNKSNKPA